jgi:hypothetical protein
MGFLTKINGIESLGGGKSAKPENRYLNLDGSTYNNSTNWTRHIQRFLTMPSVQAGAITTAFLAAGHALSQPQSARQADFIGRTLADMPWVFVLNGWDFKQFYKRLPVSKRAVIDKKGHWTSDPTATIKMESYYKSRSKYTAAIAAVLYTGFSVAINNNLLDMYPACLMAVAGWYYYAGRNLGKGKWTIQTSPPIIETKKAEVASGLLPEGTFAPIPVRGREAPLAALKSPAA